MEHTTTPAEKSPVMLPPRKDGKTLSGVLLTLLLAAGVCAAAWWFTRANPKNALAAIETQKPAVKGKEEEDKAGPKAPELDGGVAWLNTSKPIRMADLKGKVVVLDFWTLCCINCIHTLPGLAKLEKKYPNELVVIGVHSAKFDNERDTESIRKAILRYEIKHPVVNDANMEIWRNYGVRSWPSLYLIDPEGVLVARGSGEGLHEALDDAIGKLIVTHREKKTLISKPVDFGLAAEKTQSPLFFPGKVLADAKSNRLFIADSTNHRLVITDLGGNKLAIVGQVGKPGFKDGSFDQALFDDPQGMALDGEFLYVADRKNHSIRLLDLQKKTVSTLAGTGQQGHDRDRGGPADKVSLNSPWDLFLQGEKLFIALAGHHQIWTLDLKKKILTPFAGDGRETLRDGPLPNSCFAQPSGLASDGKNLFVADSEVSAIRSVPLDGEGKVSTIVGLDLFEFGDVDGIGDKVRLQHALGVAWHEGLIYVADTYNSKIKTLDPKTRESKTFLGGSKDGWVGGGLFNEPAGISISGGKIFVADTNAHRIQVIDLKTKSVSTLSLKGVPQVTR